jgi:hypothetical protein
MEPYLSEDYLNLFKKVQNTPKESPVKFTNDDELKPINEVGKYKDMPKLNEVNDLQKYKINENINDGWDNNFEVETRVNGIVQRNNADPYNQQMKRNVPVVPNNGLEKYMIGDEEDLREIYDNKVIRLQDTVPGNTNENVNDVDVVTVEMFEKMSYQALAPLAPKINSVDTRKVVDDPSQGLKVNEIKSIYS